MHFCSDMMVKEPKKPGKSPCMIIFCEYEQQFMFIELGKKYGLMKYIPLVFRKNFSAQVLKANMKIVGNCEYGLLLYRDKLPKFNIALPRMVMLTYRMPDEIQEVAKQGEFDEFDLNVFFAAEVKGANARFKYENEVQKWLNLIRGSYLPASVDDMKLGQDKRPPMPFSDTRLLNVLSHTIWFLPNIASCFAMANLLAQRQNKFYHDYKVIVCAGTAAGIGLDALYPVLANMGDPLTTKTITLTCGKLTTGVTVKPWTGIFMLRNLKSPETYFQAAFRVQSPWEVKDEDGRRIIMKNECYVFDFALDRALRQISDYSCRLDINESNPEAKVGEFIKFLPVLAFTRNTI